MTLVSRCHRAIMALAGLVLGAVLVPALVSAHADYVGSAPEAGATVATAPSNVRVFFSSAIRTGGSSLEVLGPGGARVDNLDGAPLPDPNRQTLRATLRGGLGNGLYTVNWTNEAEDGHRASGSIVFTVGPVTPTTPPAIGGRDFAASATRGPAVRLAWTDGTQENHYLLARLAPGPVVVLDCLQTQRPTQTAPLRPVRSTAAS